MLVCSLQRFLPSEFGLDPARMGDALKPGRVTFVDKMAVRKAIEEANIPFTYISANLFAGYFAGCLSQWGLLSLQGTRCISLGMVLSKVNTNVSTNDFVFWVTTLRFLSISNIVKWFVFNSDISVMMAKLQSEVKVVLEDVNQMVEASLF